MAKENLKSNKYIVFSLTQRKLEIDIVLGILNAVFLEAFHLGRIPVIGRFTVPPPQNLYVRKDDFRFEDYFDLSKIVVRAIDRVDKIIKDSQEWIKEEEFDLESYTADKVGWVTNEVVSQEMNERYDVIVRKDPKVEYLENYALHKRPEFLLDLPYSEKVNQLTDLVLEMMGTSKENALSAQYYFLDKVATMRSCFDENTKKRGSSISLRKAFFACMYVQGKKGSRLDKQPLLRFAASPKQIRTLLSYAISKGSRLYIMSDIKNPQHFDFLKGDYQVYRYHDFPELKQLVSGEKEGSIDNVMLSLVERNIMKYATVKILPPNKNSMMYHLNEVYDLSQLKDRP